MPKITKLCLNLSKLCQKYCGLFFSGHGVYDKFLCHFVHISVAQSLVDKEFVEYKKHRYVIQRPDKTTGDGAVADVADDDDDSRCERSILVMDVPDNVIDEVMSLLENERKGGGEIELRKRDMGALLVTFVSKDGQYCERH